MTNQISTEHSNEFMEASFKAQWERTPGIQAEFTSFEAFRAYSIADLKGRAQIFSKPKV